MGYFYLPTVLLIDLFLSMKNGGLPRRYPYLLAEMRRNLRFTVPLLFVMVCVYSLTSTSDAMN
jgi:hypothetical protein